VDRACPSAESGYRPPVLAEPLPFPSQYSVIHAAIVAGILIAAGMRHMAPAFRVSIRSERNASADIRVHSNGKFVYGSNRGHDNIAVFRVEKATGKMTPLDIVKTQGSTPRGFNFELSGRYIFAANQASNNVVTLAVDPDSGM
jgi:hypothetical protein